MASSSIRERRNYTVLQKPCRQPVCSFKKFQRRYDAESQNTSGALVSSIKKRLYQAESQDTSGPIVSSFKKRRYDPKSQITNGPNVFSTSDLKDSFYNSFKKEEEISDCNFSNSLWETYNDAINQFQKDGNITKSLKLFLSILDILESKAIYRDLDNECSLGKLSYNSIPSRLSVMLWCLFLKAKAEDKKLPRDILKKVNYHHLKELVTNIEWLSLSGNEVPINLNYFSCIADVSLNNVKVIHQSKNAIVGKKKSAICALELIGINIESGYNNRSIPLQKLLENFQVPIITWKLQKLNLVCSKESTQIDVQIDDLPPTLEYLHISGTKVSKPINKADVNLKYITFDCIYNSSVIKSVLKKCIKLHSLQIIMDKPAATKFSRRSFLIPSLKILKLENVEFESRKETNVRKFLLPKLVLTGYSFASIKDLITFFKVSDMLIVVGLRLSKHNLAKLSEASLFKRMINSEGQDIYVEYEDFNKSDQRKVISKVSFQAACDFQC